MRPWLVVALTVLGDQLSKFLIRTFFNPTESLPLVPFVLHLTYVQNTGAAFGLFQGYTGTFALLSIVVAVWVVMELAGKRKQGSTQKLGLSLTLGGALGNLIDRLWFGYVTDFIDVRVWPVFNLADCSITIGVGLLIWSALRRR